MWDLIVSVPDHCLSFYFPDSPKIESGLVQMIMMGKSIRQMWVNSHLRKTSNEYTALLSIRCLMMVSVRKLDGTCIYMALLCTKIHRKAQNVAKIRPFSPHFAF